MPVLDASLTHGHHQVYVHVVVPQNSLLERRIN
jgi:hypothetical protein